MTGNDKIIEEAKAEILPFDSWERLPLEGSAAFAAFCVFRDLEGGRNIKTALESVEKEKRIVNKRYGTWRCWASEFRWKERAADYDRYIESLKQTEVRKTIEAQGEKHRLVTGKILDVVTKKLDTMNPEELTQSNLIEWVQTAVKADREASNLWFGGLTTPSGKTDSRQGELNFVSDFQGL